MALRHRSLIITLTFSALVGIAPGPVPAVFDVELLAIEKGQ